MRILALETSCDDTAAAIVEDGRWVLASVVESQNALHAQYGGILPELAARFHVEAINRVVEQALQQANLSLDAVDRFAATLGPGLIGSLLVGATTAKTLAWLQNKPFVGVHHLLGHVASVLLDDSRVEPPFLALLVSGGHTQLLAVESTRHWRLVGQTLDDAVGEAYDKVARLLGLPYPGGPLLDKVAQQGDFSRYTLPIARTQQPWDFSFSGLKTAMARLVERETQTHGGKALPAAVVADLAASFQHTVAETLVRKTVACAQAMGYSQLALCGGVSANSALRMRFLALANDGFSVAIPPMAYCMDNAAMIGAAAFWFPSVLAGQLDVFSRGVAVLPVDTVLSSADDREG